MSLEQQGDVLSAAARDVLKIDAVNAYEKLVVHGSGNPNAKEALEALKPADLFGVPVKSLDDAAAVMSGLWLWHDFLDTSHTISQSLPSKTGSFWHAIMHRREGDFSNSKYWNARAAGHQVYTFMEPKVNAVIGKLAPDKLILRLTNNGYDPNAFVDLVQEVYEKPDDPRYPAAVSIQRVEWQLLVDYCVRAAVS